ncbi:hypothetical protein CL634_07680 [bacterium]|nr:hypothetical protein [bacterium]|tara:strand:- start:456 stop:905 length:450 start_codon:yes stop_codon:yes gene_type:complete
MTVSKTIDQYVNQYGDKNPIWVVTLSNDETIYQDDNRPGVKPESAWIRLKSYCQENGLHITSMKIKNRSHVVEVDSDCDGYFFCKGAGGFMFGDTTYLSFSIGTLQDGELKVRRWSLPEIEPSTIEFRDPDEAGDMLICKKGILDEQKL